jgi:hypothetical protein
LTTYRPLFDLRIKHDFYADGRCSDIEVVASGARVKYQPPQADPAVLQAPQPPELLEAGSRVVERLQLVAKARPDGVEVFACCRTQQPVVTFAGVTIAFALRVRTPSFPSFTDAASWRATRPTWVRADGQSGALELTTGDAVVPPKQLAFAEIRGCSSTWVTAPRHFTIQFGAQQARWVYYIVNSGQPLASPPKLVEDQGRLAFAAAELDPQTDDPIAAQLETRYPTAERYRLVSQAEVGCRKQPDYRLRLSLDGLDDPAALAGEPLLALPALHEVSQLKISAHDPTAQQCFYKVVTL